MPKKITAYMNNGRWLIDCPVCGTPLPGWDIGVICPRCFPGMLARVYQKLPSGLLRPLTDVEIVEQTKTAARNADREYAPLYPVERAQIEKVLQLRKARRFMNWVPSETVQDLIAQNIAHGDPVPDLSGISPRGVHGHAL